MLLVSVGYKRHVMSVVYKLIHRQHLQLLNYVRKYVDDLTYWRHRGQPRRTTKMLTVTHRNRTHRQDISRENRQLMTFMIDRRCKACGSELVGGRLELSVGGPHAFGQLANR